VLSRVRALPPYLLADIDDLKWKLRREGRDVIDLCLGSPDLPPPPSAIDALIAGTREPDASRYMPSPGIPELTQAVADWYRRRHGIEIDPAKEVAVTVGSKEGIGHLLLALLDPGEVAVVPTPSYPAHHYGVVIAGGVPAFYPVGPGLDPVGEVTQAITRAPAKPKLLIVNYPHNPTTAVCDAGVMKAFGDLARAEDLILISDMAYADLCFDGYQAPSLLSVPGVRERAVEFTTLSKGRSMAGWRVGFCVGDAEIVGALKAIKRYTDYGHFKPIQRGAIAALADDAYGAELASTYAGRRDVLCAALARAGWPVEAPRATMFVWARLPPSVRTSSLAFAMDLLQTAGVAVAPGATFGEAGEGHVRFGLIESHERLREAASKIGDFLRLRGCTTAVHACAAGCTRGAHERRNAR
jgi:alanine-synthesizing transaminase